MPIVYRVATAILLSVGSLAGAQPSAATGAWKCDRAEAEAVKQAPLGATRIAKGQLRIRWARGTSTFRDSGVVAGDEGGTRYTYCGFRDGFHLLTKSEEELYTGVLLNHATGKVLPAGHTVVMSPGRTQYLAVVQPHGMDGEEWEVRSTDGAVIWKGYAGLLGRTPDFTFDMVLGELTWPRWTSATELTATFMCKSQPSAVSLKRDSIGWAWSPRLECVHGKWPPDDSPRTADPLKRGLKLTDFPRFVHLQADGVWAYEEIRQPGFTTVSLIVIGRDGVLIADGQGSLPATQTMLDRIKLLTPLPVRWYVVGSDHGDHTGGNAALPKDVTMINRANLGGDERSIDVGGRTVKVLFLGRAHTGTDLSVYLPSDKILFMSEAYLNRVFPAMRSAYPSEWVRVADRALAMDVRRFVPAHGFVEWWDPSREELVAFRDALVYVIAEVKRLHALGLSAADAAAQANWGKYADWFLREPQAPIAIRRIYDEIEGKLPPL